MDKNTIFAAVAFASVLGAATAADIATLEAELDKARAEAPIAIQNFQVVKEPAHYFGGYEPRGNANFKTGDEMHFYAEPRNLVFPKSGSGKYNIAFAVDLEVTDSSGKTLKKNDFQQFKIDSRSRIQDLFLNLTVSLTSAPAGKYNVKFRIRDKNSKKSAEFGQDVVLR